MYQIPELLKFPKLFHAFSTKDDGDLSANFDLESKTVQRRGKFLGKLKLKLDDCIKMQVAHDDEIVEANEELKGISLRDWKKSVNVDGLVTNRNGIFLFLLIADCLPIIFYDPLNKAVGLIHAGWKGADLNIVGKAIKKLNTLYATNPKDLIVGIGPAARKDSFVKENPSQKDDTKWNGFIENVGNNKYKVDFVELCKKQLIDVGVPIENIFDSYILQIRILNFIFA